jgi:hypothetical protein
MQTNKGKSVSEFKEIEYSSNNESRQVFLSEKERNSNPFARGPLALWLISAMDTRGHYE